MLEVTQADREAAAVAYTRENRVPMDCLVCQAILTGEKDGQEIVQRFARHRLAERDAVVKWLRRMQGNAGKWSPMEQTVAASCRYLADAIEAGEPFK